MGGQILPHLCKSYDLHEIRLTQKGLCFSIDILQIASPCLPYHGFITCGAREAFTCVTILKKCGKKTSSGGQERHILTTNIELIYLVSLREVFDYILTCFLLSENSFAFPLHHSTSYAFFHFAVFFLKLVTHVVN